MNRAAVILLLAMLLPWGSVRAAHPARLVAANVALQRDGRFRVTARFDFLAFLLNDTPDVIDDEAMNGLLDGPSDELERLLNEACERFLREFTVRDRNDKVVARAGIRSSGRRSRTSCASATRRTGRACR